MSCGLCWSGGFETEIHIDRALFCYARPGRVVARWRRGRTYFVGISRTAYTRETARRLQWGDEAERVPAPLSRDLARRPGARRPGGPCFRRAATAHHGRAEVPFRALARLLRHRERRGAHDAARAAAGRSGGRGAGLSP